MTAESFDKLQNLLSHKEIVNIDINGVCNDQGVLEQNLTETIKLNPNVSHKIALVTLETASYFPNLTSKDNKFFYATDTSEQKTITLQAGAYEIKDYNESIKQSIEAYGDDKNNIDITINPATAIISVTLKDGYKVYFNKNNTWREQLGFDARDLTTNGTHISDKKGCIVPIQKIYVGCNLCKGSIGNRDKINRSNILYSFPNSKRFGAAITIEPPVPRWRELLRKEFDSVRMEFFSDDGDSVDFMKSQVTAELQISQE